LPWRRGSVCVAPVLRRSFGVIYMYASVTYHHARIALLLRRYYARMMMAKAQKP
jgi:hypothetical protein